MVTTTGSVLSTINDHKGSVVSTTGSAVSTINDHKGSVVSTTITKDDHSPHTKVIIATVTAGTILLILVIITIILALYWSFKIKLARERYAAWTSYILQV